MLRSKQNPLEPTLHYKTCPKQFLFMDPKYRMLRLQVISKDSGPPLKQKHPASPIKHTAPEPGRWYYYLFQFLILQC